MALLRTDDPSLDRLLRRQLMGTASWLMFLIPAGYALANGWMTLDWRGLAVFFVLGLGCNIVFFLLIRNGWTRRFRDRSLTFAQILASQLLALAMLYFAQGDARSLLLMLFVASLFFGVFGMRTREFLLLTAIAVGGYAGLVALENPGVAWTDPSLRIEGMRLLVLAMILLWMSFLGSYVSDLRLRLHRRNDELALATEKLKTLVSHDELTGVFNRRHLLGILGRERERAERYGLPFCVCLIDLDHFKKVNDGYGHAVGDDVLRGFAARMLACARKIDWVGRQRRGAALAPVDDDEGIVRTPSPYSGTEMQRAGVEVAADNTFGRFGGEEFLLVLPHTPLVGAKRAIERLRELVLAAPFDTGSGPLKVTFSAGIAEYRAKESVADTLARADMALYKAKELGRNRTEVELG